MTKRRIRKRELPGHRERTLLATVLADVARHRGQCAGDQLLAIARRASGLGACRVKPPSHAHRGFTLVEMVVAAVLLTAVFVAVAPIMGWVAAQQRLNDQRQYALQEVGNAMEQVFRMPRDAITQQSLKQMTLSEEASDYLKQAEFEVSVSQLTGPPMAKRISIELSWQNRAGEHIAPVRLISFVRANDGM